MIEPSVTELTIAIDYGQVYIYGAYPQCDDPEDAPVLRALDDANRTKRFVGVADGLIDFVVPVQWNFAAPMRVEVWPSRPPADDGDWDHVVDVDLDVPEGTLWFEASGGGEPIPCSVPTGQYRARLAGRCFDNALPGDDATDSYRLRLWPRTTPSDPELRKAWPGYAARL